MLLRVFSSVRVLGAAFPLVASLVPARATLGQSATVALPGLSRVEAMLATEFARDSMGSMTAGIVRGDSLVWTASYGYADMTSKRLATRATIYRIGSITKMFTATMLMQLEQQGRLRLSDPVARYFPAIAAVPVKQAGGAPVTLWQLATMTSGLSTEVAQGERFDSGSVGQWEATLQRSLPYGTFEHPAGTHFQYSNLGYAVLGAALARVAGVPFVQWQQERILRPLGMQHTFFERTAAMGTDLATGYVVADGRADSTVPMREVREGRGYRVPNGALFSTVDDLARFLSFSLGRGPEAVLPAARLARAYGGTVATSADDSFGYGLGFMLQRREDFPWLGHSGGVPGYQAVMYFDRDHQLGVILLRNASGGRASVNRVGPDALKVLILEKLAAERTGK